MLNRPSMDNGIDAMLIRVTAAGSAIYPIYFSFGGTLMRVLLWISIL
jgi:hypothetical protein